MFQTTNQINVDYTSHPSLKKPKSWFHRKYFNTSLGPFGGFLKWIPKTMGFFNGFN